MWVSPHGRRYDLDLLKAANVNFIKAETANQRRVSAYWHEVSSRLDNIFGTLIPAACASPRP